MSAVSAAAPAMLTTEGIHQDRRGEKAAAAEAAEARDARRVHDYAEAMSPIAQADAFAATFITPGKAGGTMPSAGMVAEVVRTTLAFKSMVELAPQGLLSTEDSPDLSGFDEEALAARSEYLALQVRRCLSSTLCVCVCCCCSVLSLSPTRALFRVSPRALLSAPFALWLTSLLFKRCTETPTFFEHLFRSNPPPTPTTPILLSPSSSRSNRSGRAPEC
jgi:hypothetical protein